MKKSRYKQEKLGHANTLKRNDKRRAKYKEQRKEWGWDSTELWNLDITIAKFLIPRLKLFKDTLSHHPGDITFEEWEVEIQKMIDAFEIIKNRFEKLGRPIEEIEKDEIKVNQGLESFTKYFDSLWN